MKNYRVTIETSIEVEATTPEAAATQATAWAEESLSDSNAMGNVFDAEDEDSRNPIHTFEP